MMLLETAVALVVDVLLGIWLGSMVFFSFIGAPTTFEILEEEAREVVTAIVSKYHTFGATLGFTAINLVVVAQSEEMLDSTSSLMISPLLLVALSVTVYAQTVLVPKMKRAENGFARYHRRSVLLSGVSMLSVAGCLVFSHF